MNIRTYCLVITFIFALLSPAFGEEAATPPAEGEQGSAPLAQPEVTPWSEPPPAATSPQGQGSSTAAGEEDASSPATDQQATSPEASPPVVGAQDETPSAAESQDSYSAPGAQQESSSSAGEPGSAPLTVQESIEIALQKSPTLQAAQSAIKEAKYRRMAAVSDFLPQVSTQYSYTRLDKEPYFSVPPLIPKTQIGTRDVYNWTSTITQPVFTGGALINSFLLARLGVDAARVELERTRLDLILSVKEAYYGVLTAEKGVEVAQQTVAQLESNLEVAQAFFDVGMTAKNDLLQVEVSMAQVRQYLITARNALEVTRAVFNTLLRRDINEPVRLVETLEYVPMTIDMDRFIEEAYQERPELTAAELGVKSAKRGVGLAASGLFPQVSVLFNYEREGDTPRVNGSRFQSDADSWYVTAVAQWNVWDWGKTWWGVSENKAKVFQAKCALEEIKDGVRLEIQEASLRVTEASKNIQVAETAVSQAEENFRINEERYKGQVATSTDVLDALTLLVQAKTNYYRALSDYNIAKARLQRAIGGR